MQRAPFNVRHCVSKMNERKDLCQQGPALRQPLDNGFYDTVQVQSLPALRHPFAHVLQQ